MVLKYVKLISTLNSTNAKSAANSNHGSFVASSKGVYCTDYLYTKFLMPLFQIK